MERAVGGQITKMTSESDETGYASNARDKGLAIRIGFFQKRINCVLAQHFLAVLHSEASEGEVRHSCDHLFLR